MGNWMSLLKTLPRLSHSTEMCFSLCITGERNIPRAELKRRKERWGCSEKRTAWAGPAVPSCIPHPPTPTLGTLRSASPVHPWSIPSVVLFLLLISLRRAPHFPVFVCSELWTPLNICFPIPAICSYFHVFNIYICCYLPSNHSRFPLLPSMMGISITMGIHVPRAQ